MLPPSYPSSSASSSRHHPSFSVPYPPTPPSKKRKIDRACDACRRRKTRCDGPQTNDNVCTNCRHAHRHCTYLEASKPRGPPKAYINGLEDRMEKMEALLKRLRPEIDFSKELGPPVVRDSWKKDSFHPESSSDLNKQERSPSSSSSPASHPHRNVPKTSGYHSDPDYMPEDDNHSADEEDPYEAELARTIETMDKRLKLTEFMPSEKSDRRLDRRLRYHGSSSPHLLAAAAQEHRLKHFEAVGSHAPSSGDSPPGPADRVWEGSHREMFWRAPEWELEYEGLFLTTTDFPDLDQCWPEPDLAPALIDIYFRHFNSMFPLLHRPTFDRQYADQLYKRDIWYACVCMGVFAIASRHINDPRVLFNHSKYNPGKDESKWHSAGIKYYYVIMRVLMAKQSIMTPSSLFEVQTICLSTHFQRDTCWQGGSWTSISTAIRKVQDIGGHRKRSYQLGHSVENELWKRAWWFIVGMDRTGSAAMGRPCSTGDDDMDVELPLDVDDEFWESDDPTQAFRQPPEKPSLVKAYILWLGLTEITAEVVKHFYIANEFKALAMKHPEQPNDILKRLNAKMTEWIESVPDYLKWSPDIQDPIIANQSATLFLNYNLVTILLQRAFLPPTLARIRELGSPYRQAIPGYPQALTTLAIAVNSAKAGTRVLDVARRRGLPNVPLFLSSSDVFAAVLCLDVWVLKVQEKTRRLNAEDPSFETMQKIEALMADLHTIIQSVEDAVPRWESAQNQA
ncbi:fungal-specific transcription factor domain-containing protein [Amylostereum chailletii]|nr:fungal-specific transcription factor domain-containing protein [Amylostereum chailletii]